MTKGSKPADDPNSIEFYIRQELDANRKAVRIAFAAIRDLIVKHPNLAPALRKVQDEMHEALCWND